MIGMYAFAYPNMIVEHYTAERGLPNNIVNCTLKGQDGFIWFGTWYGLCSFDGSKFRSYDNHDGFYSTDIPPRKIQRIVEDKNGFLWIKTIDRKLYLFDKRHESFHAVYDDVKEYSENIQIIKIQTTEDGDVLLLTKDKSLLRAYTDKEGKITMKQLHDSRPNVNVYGHASETQHILRNSRVYQLDRYGLSDSVPTERGSAERQTCRLYTEKSIC